MTLKCIKRSIRFKQIFLYSLHMTWLRNHRNSTHYLGLDNINKMKISTKYLAYLINFMGSMCRVHAGSGMIGEMDMIKVLGKKNNSKKNLLLCRRKKRAINWIIYIYFIRQEEDFLMIKYLKIDFYKKNQSCQYCLF